MRGKVAVAALWLASSACSAGSPSPLDAVIATPDHRAAVLELASHDPSWFLRGCETATFAVLPGHKLWDSPSFDASGKPSGGEWTEQVRATGCGVTRVLNVDSLAGAAGIAMRRLPPGHSRASPVSQDKAAMKVWAAATASNPPGCKPDYIDDTEVIGRHAADTPVWSERWSLKVCGRPVVVVVDYRLLYAGDDIQAHRSE